MPDRRSRSRSRSSTGSRRNAVTTYAFKRNGLDISDRIISAVVYVLPLCDGLRFSRYFFLQFPSFTSLLVPFAPFVKLFSMVPFAGLVAFLGLQLGVINNQSLSRFVRYNALQVM